MLFVLKIISLFVVSIYGAFAGSTFPERYAESRDGTEVMEEVVTCSDRV